MTFPTKEEAFDALEFARSEFLSSARAVARQLGRDGQPVTVDQVRIHGPKLPSGVDGRVYGAIFLREEWKAVGYIKSSRKTCHNRPICQFVLRGHNG